MSRFVVMVRQHRWRLLGLLAALFVLGLLAALLARAPQGPAPAPESVKEQTRPGKARATMKPQMLAALRETAGKIHARRRWSDEDRARYSAYCLDQGRLAPEKGLNDEACACMLEVLMDAHAGFDAYVEDAAARQGKADEKTARGVGICVVAFGSQ